MDQNNSTFTGSLRGEGQPGNISKAGSAAAEPAVGNTPQADNLPVWDRPREAKTFFYNNTTFIPHSDLHPDETAAFVMSGTQKKVLFFGLGTVLIALLVNWQAAALVTFALLTLVYFLDLLFNIFLAYRSFKKAPAIAVSEGELSRHRDWPAYTIFCPLYKEWQVVPQFINAMKALDYPQDKLQIVLLLEEGDEETVQKVTESDLPANFEVVVVPHSLPKTKPKAMNYGLRLARGEFLVIYDAEDVPEPQQLKKAVLAFNRVNKNVVCIQAKLNFYNPHQNILTKIFTAEYSLWFDLVLPGLQSINAPIPLGGTSNHFRIKDLKSLKGWDAFNVTEDCDLGMRLAKRGFQTQMVDSTTYEEANSGLLNWYRQRSRWVKGYIQTYLVHMRHARVFWEEGDFRNLAFFQLVVGAKVLSMFINPVMWAITLCYFLFRGSVGPIIEPLFPSPVLYIGVFSFVFGNFLYLYNYMIGCAKRGFDGLIKYVFLVPLYWLGMSLAAWKAVYELATRPHYWQKTVHGLHLDKSDKPRRDEVSPDPLVRRPHNVLLKSGILVAALGISSLLNSVYSVFLGRVLSLEEFGMIAFFNTVTLFCGVGLAALATTVNHHTAFVAGRGEDSAGLKFLDSIKNKSYLAAGLAVLSWLALMPVIMPYFRIENIMLGLLFAPVLFFGVVSSLHQGVLEGLMKFYAAAAVIVTEGVVKFLTALILVNLGLGEWVLVSIPAAVLAAGVMAWILARRSRIRSVPDSTTAKFSFGFFAGAVITGFASIALLGTDILLVKRFLDPASAGQYALLSLAGKAVFFSGSLASGLMVTLVSRSEGGRENSQKTFFRVFLATTALVSAAYLSLSLGGKFVLPFLFGNKVSGIISFLPAYSLAMALLALAGSIITYNLVRRRFVFVGLALTAAAILAGSIAVFHGSVAQIVNVVLAVSAGYFAAVGASHILVHHGRFLTAVVKDLREALFFPRAATAAAGPGQRILVFNWRDTKHEYAGGAEVYIHELARRWVKAGHQVTLFCGNDGKSARTESVDGVRVIRRGGFYLVYLWAFLYYMFQFRGRYNLIIDCENGIPFFTPLYAKERVVCLLHHVHQEVFRKYLIWPLSLVAAFLESRIMPVVYRNTKFITISHSSEQGLRELDLGLAGIEIMHPGVNLSVLKPGKKNRDPLVLYLGRLKAYKSVDVLIEAFARIVRVMPRARLAIVGGGEEEGQLKRLVKKLGLGARVYFTGKVSEKEKLGWLQRAWVLVNPSMIEGWGITTIEANACGVPVVAANVPGLRDSVRNPHTGYLVSHGDVEGFYRRITELLVNPSLRFFMSKEAVEWSKKFDWEKISNSFLDAVIGRPRITAVKIAGKKIIINTQSYESRNFGGRVRNPH